jgi:hypothetical protein
MRSIAFILAAMLTSTSAVAQSWQEYSYADYAFSVAFPAKPQIETTTHQVANGRSVAARVYSVRQNNVVFKMTVADLVGTNLEEPAVIDYAIKALSEGGEIKVNIPHRIYRVYGRQISIARADGSRSTAAVFDYKGRLYQIEASALPGATIGEFEMIRFQQSLTFTDSGSNRSEDAIRAIREACRGQANPAGLDDPRCRR